MSFLKLNPAIAVYTQEKLIERNIMQLSLSLKTKRDLFSRDYLFKNHGYWDNHKFETISSLWKIQEKQKYWKTPEIHMSFSYYRWKGFQQNLQKE